MTELAIRVQGISKRYRLGMEAQAHKSLPQQIASGAARLFGRTGNQKPAFRKEFWALSDISFEAHRGEVIGFIGPNGAGKSTLLKILARIVQPTSGRAEICGRVGALLEVGTGFHGELTGRENIFLNGAILGMTRAEIKAKLDEIVEFSGIEQFIDTPVKRYSSGMSLRLAFSVAAHVDPEILIIDEVLAVGDANFQKKCLNKAEVIAQTGRTVLFVSHQMSLVQRLCTRAVLIEQGQIRGDGPVADVVHRYLQSLETMAATDLRQRTLRTGRGGVRVARIDISGAGRIVASGQSVAICINTDSSAPRLRCLVTIFSELGDPVTSFDSAEQSHHDQYGDSFRIDIDRLLLRPGRYRLDVALLADDATVEDHVESAAAFDVQEGLLDDRLVTALPGYGSTFLPHRWTLRR